MENFKNSLIKNKKIGIVCNDAGGSEIISSWLLTKNNKVNFHLSGPAINIFKKKFSIKKNLNLSDLINNSDVIITGTSLKSMQEINAIKHSKLKKKKVISFIDHWVNYEKRFIRRGVKILPNIIVAHDSKSYHLLRKKFPKQIKINFIKNAYFKLVLNRYKNISKNKKKNKFVFFSSNNDISISNLSDIDCLKNTIRFIKKNFNKENNKIDIILRCHPSENKKKYNKIKIKNTNIVIDSNNDLLKTISENQFFFGYESMALVIAKICKKNTYGILNKDKRLNTIPIDYFNSYY